MNDKMTKSNVFHYFFHCIGLSMMIFCVLAMGCSNKNNKTVQNRLPDTNKTDIVAKIQPMEQIATSKTYKPDTIRNTEATKMSEDAFQKAIVNLQDSSLTVYENIRADYRIFGYQQPDTNSKKMVFFSVFTPDVENNPYQCPYGAYYSSGAMQDTHMKYIGKTGDFVKANLIKNKTVLAPIYILKDWIQFEKQN